MAEFKVRRPYGSWIVDILVYGLLLSAFVIGCAYWDSDIFPVVTVSLLAGIWIGAGLRKWTL